MKKNVLPEYMQKMSCVIKGKKRILTEITFFSVFTDSSSTNIDDIFLLNLDI